MSINVLIGGFEKEAREVRDRLVKFLHSKNFDLQQGSIPKEFDNHHRMWEYSNAVAFTTGLDARDKKVLDVGGANSALTWFLAELGAEVHSTDLMKKNVRNCSRNAIKHRYENVFTYPGDVGGEFDFVYSINVIEHVMEHARPKIDKGFRPGVSSYWGKKRQPSDHEVETEQKFVKYMADRVKPGGLLVVSFEFAKTEHFKCQPKCAYMRDKEDVCSRIIEVSGMKLHGGELDFTERENTENFTRSSTGIVFLRKP